MKVEVELLTPIQNNAVLSLPGRKYPGLLIQGDSLSILASQADTVASLSAVSGNSELIEECMSLKAALSDLIEQYEEVLSRHGIELPY